MDLDNMKQAWQSLSNAELRNEVSHNDIAKLIRKKSKSELNKLILTFAIECLLSIPIILFTMGAMHHQFDAGVGVYVFDALLLLMLVLLVIPTLELFKIGRLKDQSTLDYLEKLTTTFDRVLKRVLAVANVFMIASFPTGILIGFMSESSVIDMQAVISLIIAMLFCVPFYFGLMFLMRWYYNRFYVRRINRMKMYLQELKVDDEVIPIEELKASSHKFSRLSKISGIIIGLLIVAEVVVHLCGCEHGAAYYLGYGLGYAVKHLSQFFGGA